MGILYESLENVSENNDVIPESCLSFYEQALYVVDFAMNENAEFLKKFGNAELNMYRDTGILVEYVGEDADILTEAMKNKEVKIFGAMKSVFSKMDLYFANVTKNGQKIVSNIDPEVIANCPDNLGKTHTYFDFSKIKFADNAIKFGKKADAAFKNKKDISQEDALALDKEISKNIFKDIVGVEATNIKDMKEKLRAELIGAEVDVNKAWVKKNYTRMKDLVAGDKIPKEVKSSIQDQKNSLDHLWDTCYSHDGEEGYTQAVIYWEDALAGAAQIAFVAYTVVFDVYKRMHREYMNILYKVVKAGKKAVKESLVPDSEIENKDLVDQADPKEKLVPDSVVKEDAYTDKMQANLARMKEMQARADAANKKADDSLNKVNSKFGIKREDGEEESEAEVEEGAVSKTMQNAGKALSKTPPAKAGLKAGQYVRKKIDEKKAKKEEALKECDDVNDVAARHGKVCEEPAEESEGKPVAEACDKDIYDDKAAREGKDCKDKAEESQGKPVVESYTRQHVLINSLFDF